LESMSTKDTPLIHCSKVASRNVQKKRMWEF
jgi:hypothetical protein